ncbi:nucleotidyltransferase domain-containing protein [Candidatus Amesbacteria bacterium]|nr:nucleotidyltransferase domain-containing protein [Candidatus Amesbacteria bacterium]
MSQSDVKIILKKYLELVNMKYPVQNAYLFGSYAKGTWHEGSDIDVCVVSPAFGKDYFDEESLLRRDTFKVDSRISPVAFNPADFAEKYNLLAHEIKTYGIPLISQ